MFQDVNASVTYKFFDGKDESRSIEQKRIGLMKINDVYCEMKTLVLKICRMEIPHYGLIA